MKVTNQLKKNLKKVGQSQVFLYILVFISLLNLLGFLKDNNIMALVIFLLTGLGTAYLTKNMIFILLSAIIVTNLIIGLNLLKKKNLEGLKNRNRKRLSRNHKKGKGRNLQSVEEFAELSDSDDEDDDSDEEEEIKPALITNAQKSRAKERQNKIPSAVVDDDDNAAPLGKNSSMLDLLATKKKSIKNISKMLGNNNLNSMTQDATKILDHQDKLLDKLERLEPLVNRAGSMLERFQGSKLGKFMGK